MNTNPRAILRAKEDGVESWYEVVGRGSGAKLTAVHRVDVERSFGKMSTFCGVVVSVAVRVRPRPGSHCRSCRKRNGAP